MEQLPTRRPPTEARKGARAPRIAVLAAAVLLPFLAMGPPAQADPPPDTTAPGAAAAEEPRFNVLVFSGVTNYYHDSIPAGVEAVEQLGDEHDFAVTATDDASVFSDKGLRPFDAVVFNNTNSTPQKGNLLDAEQRAAFQRFVNGGGGFVGWHSATGTERDWDWYAGLVGAKFQNHPAPRPGRIEVLDRTHPSTAGLPQLWERNEEWYNWQASPNGDVHVLTEIRTTDDPEGLNEGPEHAHAWCQVYDGGRSWYTASGHHAETFSEPLFRQHILGGIEWAAGAADGDCAATEWGSFEKVQLEDDTNLADPYELAPLPDGRVLYIQRTGQIKLIHQDGEQPTTTLAGDLELNLPTTRTANGLTGLTIDDDFAENGWVYLLYTVPEEPVYRLSRFTLVGDTLDMDSEKAVLEFPIWRNELLANVHMAGSMTMDDEGNLYIATGDNTDPFESQGYTPIDERDGRRAADAQATSGNTNDLRGKIIRIHPTDDGGYTIPEGNLFPESEDTQDKTRPEIYAMGFRNPFRISYDDATDALLVADYGPDSGTTDPERGPAGLVEQNRILEAGNYGWPYCMGPNIPFVDYDFATGESGAEFDCDNPVNDSPNNTGLKQLPPAQEPLVWYGKHGEHSELFPEITGGGAPMAGPVYHYDENLESETKFPEYYDGKWFVYEYGSNWFKTVSLMNEAAPSERFEPAEPGDVQSINSFLPDTQFMSPFDAEFGPDGSLYTIDFGYGTGVGRGSHNDGSGIYRIDYVGGEQVTEPRDRCYGGYPSDVPVWFGDGKGDSGVPNHDVGDGCTIMDLVEHERPFDSHGDFVRTVGELTRELRAGGVVTARERARIVSAAAGSEVGKNPEREDPDRAVPDEKIGVVGYTVRDTMPAPDTEATLEALATCGYRNIEPSSGLYGYTGAELGTLIRDAGMKAPSAGLSFDQIANDIEGVIETAKGLGASYIRFSGSSSWDLQDYHRVADVLNEAGAVAREAGITLAYHNHGYEFEAQGGVRPYDVLVRETDPNFVTMELDLYWAVDAGVDPVALMKQYPGRFALLHVKDRAEDGSFADVGEGTIDFGRIFAHSELAGVDYYFTEHDQPEPDGISSACDSYANLRELRY
ncbi:xylose isomerase-like TIM barrel protein [Haloactinopolyspora alba]|uniref:Xylose isomerase-like TIM barrel protein n=1 Tax=Haloactinopolyspora alba TaxID=648780 RepID=A0A2P8DJ22_9ACTN|nr:ThuA domain-containing protein [Haloactinopolyspora alba]PSK97220.1 xylose isomerase-like TIM barrel protein [Haloactinopolyspora alba]